MLIDKNSIKGILFDLDGTLIDTAGDLGQALNGVLQARSRPILPLSDIRASAGKGCKGLLKLGLNMADTHPEYRAHCDELLGYYEQHIFDTTRLFPGMDKVLAYLEKKQIPWGIVTNKPERFTSNLVTALQLKDKATCVISGDTLAKSKPHPEPVIHACKLMGVNPAECIYVGDAEVDIIASNAAGTLSLVALYGYIAVDENPKDWRADGYIQQPLDILDWI